MVKRTGSNTLPVEWEPVRLGDIAQVNPRFDCCDLDDDLEVWA